MMHGRQHNAWRVTTLASIVLAAAILILTTFADIARLQAQTVSPGDARSNADASRNGQPGEQQSGLTTTPGPPSLSPTDTPALAPPPSPAAAGFKVPERPQEARAAKAYAVFETHCAQCHQMGRTERPLPSGGLTNILDVEQLTRDSVLVHPGLPDASRLYDILATRHAPLEVFSDNPGGIEPRPEEIEAVREWIADLGSGVQACHARAPVTPSMVETLVGEAQALERGGARDLRFISLAHLYNACATADEMAAYRQALTKMLNGVSWSPEPVSLTPLDPGGALFTLRLADMGWVAADWETLLKSAPPTLAPNLPQDIVDRAGTAQPLVTGDWLTAAATDPPLYYALLRQPPTLAELARLNGVDLEDNHRTGSARRALAQTSSVTHGNRLAERHAGALGGFWLIYDFATSSDEQNLLAYPLGPKRTPRVRTPFKPDQIRALFPLPNGFLATALFDGTGNRIERSLPGVETAYAGDTLYSAAPGTTAGAQCFSCHVSGVIGVKDTFRDYAEAVTSTLPADIKASALPFFPSRSEMSLLVSGDNERYRNALLAAAIDPTLRVNGEEPINALARRYRSASGFDAALAETGQPKETFVAALLSAKGGAAPLARRLQHGVLSRTELNDLFAALKGVDRPDRRPDADGFLRSKKTDIGLSMWLATPRPTKGDLVEIKVEADTGCFLTVISVNDEGQATVLFPNDFEPDNQIEARHTMSVPGLNAPYQLRFKSMTPETVIARCTLTPDPPPGIEHDFERQKFTVLGNWENFIRETIETEADLRANPEKIVKVAAARAEAQRRRGAPRQRPPEPAQMTLPTQVLRDGRAVLVIGGS